MNISSTGINRLHGDSRNERTVEVEVDDYAATPTEVHAAAFRIRLVRTERCNAPPLLELAILDATGHVIGHVPFTKKR